MNTGNIIGKSIAIVALLLCLLQMPYLYYTIVRWVVCIAMLIAFQTEIKEQDKPRLSIVIFYIVVFALFNPILLIEFDKFVWNIIDVILAVILFTSAIKEYKEVNQ